MYHFSHLGPLLSTVVFFLYTLVNFSINRSKRVSEVRVTVFPLASRIEKTVAGHSELCRMYLNMCICVSMLCWSNSTQTHRFLGGRLGAWVTLWWTSQSTMNCPVCVAPVSKHNTLNLRIFGTLVHNPLGEQFNNLWSSSVILDRVELQYRHTHHILWNWLSFSAFTFWNMGEDSSPEMGDKYIWSSRAVTAIFWSIMSQISIGHWTVSMCISICIADRNVQ